MNSGKWIKLTQADEREMLVSVDHIATVLDRQSGTIVVIRSEPFHVTQSYAEVLEMIFGRAPF